MIDFALRKLAPIFALSLCSPYALAAETAGQKQPVLSSDGPHISQDGLQFRDLDRDGRLSPYEDWRLSPQIRAQDLTARLNLQEKAGLMMHGTAPAHNQTIAGLGDGYNLDKLKHLIGDKHVVTFITRLAGEASWLAAENNKLQAIAAQGRFSIPATISSDPRHHFQYVAGASSETSSFSKWPETTGLAAIDDTKLTHHFGDIARQEYRATGIHQTLSPMADLATEPRWARINGTFGESPALVGKHVGAYIAGFQGSHQGLHKDGVSAVVKHWVGYGAAKDGFDAHSYYGRYAVFPGGAFEQHIAPFLDAFKVGVVGVMPTYSILKDLVVDGEPLEAVGAGFNRTILTTLLREKYGFQGLIVSDWAITNDCNAICKNGVPAGEKPTFDHFSTAWGMEDATSLERFIKGIEAGIDQFGGTEATEFIVEAVKLGRLPETRIDQSVQKTLQIKFEQGLFENPYVDVDATATLVGTPDAVRAGLTAQSEALVVLENRNTQPSLFAKRPKIYLHGVSDEVARRYGLTPVDSPDAADIALISVKVPFEKLHPGYPFGEIYNEGNLAFAPGQADYELIKNTSAKVPTIVTVYLDRPAVLTAIKDMPLVLIGNFGVSDTALFDALIGKVSPKGRLPFELPSSMAAVLKQHSDVPHDSDSPLYPIGHGLVAPLSK